jgi:hypothetical protein
MLHSLILSLSFLATAASSSARPLPLAFVTAQRRQNSLCVISRPRFMSDWSNFDYIDDDEDLDTGTYAKEEDTQEYKAEIGALLEAPTIEFDAEPISVVAGSQLALDEETVLGVLSACREEIGTMFGYSAENRGVGITGGVDFVEMDGPVVVLSLKGRFWHQRYTVLDRVASYLQQRIPEIIDVVIVDEYQLTDEANEAAL